MCNCKSELDKRLTANFVENEPTARNHKAELVGYAFLFDDEMNMTLKGCMPIEMTAIYPLKKGGEKEKKTKQNMIFTYCPFCGEKY